MFHFGMADATALRADDDGWLARWGLALGRGLLLLATAFAAHPAEAWAPFAEIGEALSPRAAAAWRPDLGALQRFALVGVAAGVALALASAIARARRGHARDAALDLVEHAMVAAVATLADPLFAVGCYFIGVHAFRHTRRLACTSMIVDPAATPHGREPGFARRLLRVHQLSLPLMWPTALCLAPLCWLLGGFHAGAIAAASIAFYMITTLPHHLLGLKLPKADTPPAAAS
jgi:Brp/Blh family beta-carotene 15,15'-monooxygenase